MAKYKVEVCRIGYGFTSFEVEANSEKEAEKKALERSGDHEYSEKDANYEVNYVRAIEKD